MGLNRIDLSVRIGRAVFPNPVGVASGTFGYGNEYDSLMDLSRLGAIYTKAVTLERRPGNAPPRIVETPSGMLNTIGLANPGIDSFIRDKLPELSRLPCAVIVNVAGSGEEDYLKVVERLEGSEGIAGYEINLSCPNVRHGCMSFGTDPALVEKITKALRARTERALIIKLTPNVTDIAEIAKAAESGGADAVSCINTLVGMVIDVNAKRPVLSMGTGGLSGPAIRPVGVACVHRVSKAVGIPVIGLGGIMCAEDAVQYLLAGASAIQVGTGTFVDPGIPLKTLEGIEAYMEREGLKAMSDFKGLLRA